MEDDRDMLKPAQLYKEKLQDGKLHDAVDFEILAEEWLESEEEC